MGPLLCICGDRFVKRVAAFDYDVHAAQVAVVAKSMDFSGQGMYKVTVPGITRPIRYGLMGTIVTRDASAPPLPP